MEEKIVLGAIRLHRQIEPEPDTEYNIHAAARVVTSKQVPAVDKHGDDYLFWELEYDEGVDVPDAEPIVQLVTGDGTKDNSYRYFLLWRDQLWEGEGVLRGSTKLDTGYFWAPYMPVIKPPVLLDPALFAPRKGILTRYGKKLLSDGAKFYGKYTIKSFQAGNQ